MFGWPKRKPKTAAKFDFADVESGLTTILQGSGVEWVPFASGSPLWPYVCSDGKWITQYDFILIADDAPGPDGATTQVCAVEVDLIDVPLNFDRVSRAVHALKARGGAGWIRHTGIYPKSADCINAWIR